MTELEYISLIKMIILEENFQWHLEAFASELFKCILAYYNKCIKSRLNLMLKK